MKIVRPEIRLYLFRTGILWLCWLPLSFLFNLVSDTETTFALLGFLGLCSLILYLVWYYQLTAGLRMQERIFAYVGLFAAAILSVPLSFPLFWLLDGVFGAIINSLPSIFAFLYWILAIPFVLINLGIYLVFINDTSK